MDKPPEATPRPFSFALLAAGMATVLYGAVLMAADGVLSLIADRDVITEPDAGPLVGPIMAITALIVVFLCLLDGLRPGPGSRSDGTGQHGTGQHGSGQHEPGRHAQGIPVSRAITTSILVWILGPAAGAIAYAFGQEQLMTALLFFATYLVSPFVIASVALAFAIVLLLPFISAAGSRT